MGRGSSGYTWEATLRRHGELITVEAEGVLDHGEWTLDDVGVEGHDLTPTEIELVTAEGYLSRAVCTDDRATRADVQQEREALAEVERLRSLCPECGRVGSAAYRGCCERGCEEAHLARSASEEQARLRAASSEVAA